MSALPEERYYTIDDIEALPDGQRAELIDGQIYMMTAPKRMHQKISGKIHQAINNHIDEAGLECEAYAAPFGVWLDADYVEPDLSVICDMDKLDDDGCKGSPDFVIEIISKGNTKEEMKRKFMLYHRSGVREYWTIYPETRVVMTYIFHPDYAVGYYSFDEDIPVSICEGFSINLSGMGF